MATNNATNTSNPITVAQGGTGDASLTAYAVLCGGTTSTGAVQSIASVGTAGQLLASNGAGALPTFQAAAGLGGSLVLISFQNVPSGSSTASVNFTSIGSYRNYLLTICRARPTTDGDILNLQKSTDNGSTWATTSYLGGCNYTDYNSTTFSNSNSTSSWVLSGPVDSGSTSNFANAIVYLLNINISNSPHICGNCSFFNNTSGTTSFGTFGGNNTVSASNAFRVLFSTGNIERGDFALYGIATA